MSTANVKYNRRWPDDWDDLRIELYCARQSLSFLKSVGTTRFDHYRNAQSLMWPEDDHHRWSDLTLRRLLENEIEILLGPGGSNKSYSMARYAVTDWFAWPEETLWLISSTEFRGADLRIWGDIQILFNRARKRYDWLPGTPLRSLHAIVLDTVDEEQGYLKAARSLKRGLIVVPNKRGGVYVGLSAFVGIRVKRLRHAADEASFMGPGFFDAYSNWYGNSDFRGVIAGNPTDLTDQLCTAAEPVDGWDNWHDTEKTQEWRARFFNAHVIAFDGRDSPNFDFPNAEEHPRYPYLIGPKKLKAIAATHGVNGWQWFSQCVGKPNKSLSLWRVISRQVCENNHSLDDALWKGTATTKVAALDPAYGGGDRCVFGVLEYGEDVDGHFVIKIHRQETVPINLRLSEEPEEQIVKYVYTRLKEEGIAAQNCFYDSFGKGTLGFYFAKVFGSVCPVPVNTGGPASERPVRQDLFVNERGRRRHKRCDEHYSKFVSELWFSVAECIQSGQLRNLSKDAMQEGCARIYRVVSGARMEVETKQEMKERVDRSPDLFDQIAIGVEGARQRGFRIERIGSDAGETPDPYEWFRNLQVKRAEAAAKYTLQRT